MASYGLSKRWCGVVWCMVWCGVVWCGVVSCGVVWCGVVSCGVVWCGVVWCGVVWCGVVWCGVVWCGVVCVVWCGVVWCGVVWCGVVWCGVVWCGVVWCGVVWCGVVCQRCCYQKAMARIALQKKKMQAGRAVCLSAPCVWCVAHLWHGAVTLFGVGWLPSRAALGKLCRSVLWCYQSSRWALPSVPPGRGGTLTRLALGQLTSFSTMPHYLGVVGSGDLAAYSHTASLLSPRPLCLTTLGQWVVELFLFTASLPCLTPCPLSWGVGSGTPSIHCLVCRPHKEPTPR